MMKNRNKRRTLLGLFILLITVTIGYALLSATGFIRGTSRLADGVRWNIHWDDDSVDVTTGSVEGNEPVVSGDKLDVVTFTADVELPGDFYEFTVDAVNEGTINAKILDIRHNVYESDGVTVTTLPNYIKYSIVYDENEETLAIGDLLGKGDSKTYKIRIEYDSNSEVLPGSDQTFKIVDEIDYAQTKGVVFNPDYIVTDKNTLLCTLSGRTYKKVNDGFAVVGYFYTGRWTHPLLISEEPDAVTFSTSHDSRIHSYQYTCDIDGVTYYVSSGEYAMPNNNSSTNGFMKLISTNNLVHSCDSAVAQLYKLATK